MEKTKLAAICLCALALVHCKKDGDEPNVNASDEAFIKNASVANHNEIDMSGLAASRASDASVKAFGEMMVTEHQAAQNELRTLAGNKKISISETPDDMHKQMKQQMSQMQGRTLDSAYIHSQVSDHDNTIKLFQTVIQNGKDADIKAYANKYLPHIQMHFTRADSTADRF